MRSPFVISVLLAVCALSLPAQELSHHPELQWKTIETEHFLIHYHDGAERTGNVVARIAEEIYGPVTSLYGHEPDEKVSIIIKDYEDISNGAAYFYDNKIEIWAPSMDFIFRGTHNWLRNVVTHEFTHIVQIQTSMKFGRRMPAIYFQWLGYEAERRPDVLYGFPNVIVSTPYSGFAIPAWFAEGVAQYNRKELRYDFWDSHRDMILRSYVLDGNMLTWDEMSVFGKTSLGNESSYNAGFAFVHYIAQRYGEEKVVEISRNLARFTELTIDGAIERSLGKSGRQVYDEWKDELTRTYAQRVRPVRTHLVEGDALRFVEAERGWRFEKAASPSRAGTARVTHGGLLPYGEMHPCCKAVAETGFANLFPVFSPDGRKYAFVSTGKGDYLGQSALYVSDIEKGIAEPVQPGVSTGMSWSPDGTKLYYARSTRKNARWARRYDLYVYDIERKEEKRLTHGRRVLSPSVSPDGKTIVCVVDGDGTTNLALMSTDGSDFRLLTAYMNGEQVYTPSWSPNGDRIVFAYSINDGRDIAWIHPDGSNVQFLVTGEDDARDPVFSRDGSRIIFSSDRTGIFNLHSYGISTSTVDQLTNVLGGAFMPAIDGAGNIIYSAYTSKGYKLYELPQPQVLADGDHHYVQSTNSRHVSVSGPLAMASNAPVTPQFDWSSLRNYNDTSVSRAEARPYRNVFTSLSFVPFVRVDNYNTSNKAIDVIKAGAYFFSNDVIDKLGLFGGIALNRQLERDLFLQLTYNDKLPLFYSLGLEPFVSLGLYNVTRKTNAIISLPASTIPVDVKYDLLEFEALMTQQFLSEFSTLEFRYAHSRYTSIIESFILPETRPLLLVPASSDLYLIANDLSLTFRVNAIAPTRTNLINPIGRKVTLKVGRSLNKFNGDGEYEVTSTGLSPLYKKVNFSTVEFLWREHIGLPWGNHTMTASLRGATILGPAVDEFFDYYAGGLIGMKGYPFYSLGGNELAIFGLTYRFPLVERIDLRFLNFYFDKLYVSVYSDVGNAWTGKMPALGRFRKDAGVELRLQAFSFYAYPTCIFFNASYGFDSFDRRVRNADQLVTYGKEWRFYFGILFGFDFD
jgi:hypothetical protein